MPIGADGFGYRPPRLSRSSVPIGNGARGRLITQVNRANWDHPGRAGTKIDNLCHIGRNVHIGRHCTISGTHQRRH
jgi:UDP-3-O-[3-hydroxymyristoyl] glucosamine N-acyltransferase